MNEFPEDETRPRMVGECTGCRCRGSAEPKRVPLVLDPFIREIYNEDVLVYLCDECYSERADDI
jgi:hypothetical protein